MITETELETYILGEVNNNTSNDYLQTFYFTHKCVGGIDELWYKAHTNYTVENTTSLWFKESEIEFFEDVE